VPWFKKTPSGSPTAAGDSRSAVERPTVEPLTEDEIAWVRSTIAELAGQDVRAGDIDDLGRHYDELLAGWLRLREADRPDPDGIISQIGLAFGQYLADHAGLDWGVATSVHGAEIVVHRPGNGGQVMLYPADMVAQRWGAGESGILPALARATVDAVGKQP
jgi:hypothetical protein